MSSLAITVIALWALAIIPAQNKSLNWKRIRDCSVIFSLPPEVKERKVHPIDSCVRQYRSPNILIELDAIMYVDLNGSRRDEYSDNPEFNLKNTIIDGQKAEIITCLSKNIKEANGLNYIAVLYVPQMPKARGNLTIWTHSKSPTERERAI